MRHFLTFSEIIKESLTKLIGDVSFLLKACTRFAIIMRYKKLFLNFYPQES